MHIRYTSVVQEVNADFNKPAENVFAKLFWILQNNTITLFIIFQIMFDVYQNLFAVNGKYYKR